MSNDNKPPREWWIDPIETGDDGEIQVFDALSKHPQQGPLNWQANLIHAIEASAFTRQAKLIESLERETLALRNLIDEITGYFDDYPTKQMIALLDKANAAHDERKKF